MNLGDRDGERERNERERKTEIKIGIMIVIKRGLWIKKQGRIERDNQTSCTEKTRTARRKI